MRPDPLEPLSPSMRELLDAERPLDSVPAHTRTRLFAKVSATVAGAAVVAVGGSAAAAGVKAGAASVAGGGAVATTTALTTKVIIAAIAFSVGGGVGAGVHAVAVPQKLAPAPAPIVLKVVKPEPEPVVQLEPVAVPEPVPVVKPQPARPKVLDHLEAERSLVEQARTALSRHQAAAALSALSQHEREYPAGQLTEERIALQVLALSESGDSEKAQGLAKRFRAQYPHSLLMPAVDAAAP